MRMKLLILPTLFFFLLSCTQKKDSINGVWKSHGSGWILHIQDSSSFRLHDVTSISCVLQKEASLSELLPSLRLDGDTLLMKKGISSYKFYGVTAAPPACYDLVNNLDPLFNFDVFSEIVKTHYAFLELNNIDWDEMSASQRSKLEADPSELTLYRILDESLVMLNDNHRYLEASDEFYEKYEAELEENDETDSLPEYGDFQIANMVADHFLQEELTEDSWLIKWGKMTDHIGYAQIKAMWLYADLKIEDSLKEEMGFVGAYVHTFHQMDENAYIEMERAAVAEIMDQVMTDFAGMDTIILDVRFNGGGQDAVSQEIMSRFNNSDEVIFQRMVKYHSKLIHSETIRLPPRQGAFGGPVYVLVSPQSGSAAESFAMAGRQIRNVNLIGSATQGALSTSLEKKLPNGWHIAISDEMYLDENGISYENIGVPVDVELNYLRERQPFFRSIADDLDNDKKGILEAIRK